MGDRPIDRDWSEPEHVRIVVKAGGYRWTAYAEDVRILLEGPVLTAPAIIREIRANGLEPYAGAAALPLAMWERRKWDTITDPLALVVVWAAAALQRAGDRGRPVLVGAAPTTGGF